MVITNLLLLLLLLFIVSALRFFKCAPRTFLLLLYGKTGRDLIDQLTKHVKDWNNGTTMHHITLKVAIIHLALALQNPSQNLKQKNTNNVSKSGWDCGKW